MSYQVLARKWRPGKFSELVGQEHVVNAISNALDNNRLHHAYLFTGTRGVGKTTIARIFARSLNCDKGMSSNPCGVCDSCKDIEHGNFVDLLEIDAASRTKVEDTRELLDNVQYRPTRGDYKVYLIDEVHMLSKHSFNALLKTLEEPPPHVKFLLATTDPQKLPITILSRCLQFNLKALTREQISGQLAYVLKQENLPYDEAALALLAKSAQGSMRDALSLTDQAIAQGNGQVLSQVVSDMLGLIDNDKIARLTQAIIIKDKLQVFQLIDELALCGADFKSALSELMSVFHQVALTQFVPEVCKIETTQARQVFNWAKVIPPEQIQLLYQIALQGRKDIEWAQDPKMGFEMAVLRMLAFMPESVADNLEQFKKSADIAVEAHTQQSLESGVEPPENLIKHQAAEKKTLTNDQEQISSEQTAEVDHHNTFSVLQDNAPRNESLEQELDGILKQAESLTPQSSVNSEIKSEDTVNAESDGIESALEVKEVNESDDVHDVQDAYEVSVHTPEYEDSEGENYADDYHMLSTMEAVETGSALSSDPGAEVKAVVSEDADTSNPAKTDDLPAKPASISNTMSLLNLMGTLAKAPEEGKDNNGSSTYGNHQSQTEDDTDKTAEKVKPYTSDEVAENTIYQDDILAPQNSGQSNTKSSSDVGHSSDSSNALANAEEEPHIFNPESLVTSKLESEAQAASESEYEEPVSVEETSSSVEQDASCSAGQDVTPLVEQEESVSDELLDLTAIGPQESSSNEIDESSAQPDVQQRYTSSEELLPSHQFVIEPYEPEATQGEDNNPESEQQHYLESEMPLQGAVDARFDEYQEEDQYYPDPSATQDNFDAEEEEYHELFAGPIPKVSVDFEIPVRVNGKKVVNASQLDTWSQLIEQSGIGGLNKQLALHSNYVLQGDNVKLIVSEHQRHLFTDNALAAIEEALSETLQHDVNVSAHIGEVIDTPAAVQYAINNMRQEYAVKTIKEDSGVQALCNAFSGTVLNDTIEPR